MYYNNNNNNTILRRNCTARVNNEKNGTRSTRVAGYVHYTRTEHNIVIVQTDGGIDVGRRNV